MLKSKVYEEIEKVLCCDFVLEKPKDIEFGDYATPIAFSLAKELRKSPIAIAEELEQKFQNSEIFESVVAIKGYLNFKLKEDFLDEFATKALKEPKNFAKGDLKEKILVEFVSANPTGPLHIGHARGAVFGDSLCRIARHLGVFCTSEYYVNDAGAQIENLGLSIWCKLNDKPLEEGCYKGEYIDDVADDVKDKFGEEFAKNKANLAQISSWAKDKMLVKIKQNLQDANISFDNFVSEKELYKSWDETFKKLQDSGKTYEKDSKIWLKSTELGDEKDRVVLRDDGNPTYIAGDIIYHYDKFKRNYDKCVNIWGADHHGYIARVKAAINFLGYDESKLEVILAQMVSLLKDGKPYKMSKRAGNFVLMSEIVDEIGSDALRFVFLSKKVDTQLEFDVETLKTQDSSNPIFYINYAHARVNQVFEKSQKSLENITKIKLENLSVEAKNLLFNALLLKEVLEDAYSSRALQKLPEYLKNLATLFHKFYNENKVIGSQNEEQYLKIFATTALSIRVGLSIMGIKAKAKM